MKPRGSVVEVASEQEKGNGSGRPCSDPVGEAVAELQTCRGIKSRQAQMIALGGTIGTGFFVGAGQGLVVAGPGLLFLAYCIICMLVYGVVVATIEVSSYLPVRGCSMAYYGNRFVSRSFGAALGWLYWYTYAVLVGYEATAASLVINYWPGARHVPVAVWVSVMLAVVIFINFLPVRIYGETEFWFASLKVLLLVGLLVLSFILFWGGGPNRDRLGFRYWQHPGATKEYLVSGDAGRFLAFVYVLGFSCFSFFFSPELIVLTGGEMRNPRKNLKRASRHYMLRLFLFYLLGTLAIGVICNSDSPGLTNGGFGAAASPWVIAIQNAGIGGLDSVVNAVIITSAWSAGNSYLYMASRSLYSLAISGNAPSIFRRCNRWGVPYVATIASSFFSLLGYLNADNNGSVVFDWFVSLTNTAGFISWICCCIVYLRFRKAVRAQAVADMHPSPLQPYATYVCMVVFTILLLLNGFSVFFPGRFTASTFLTAYIGIPAFLLIYLGYRLLTRREPWMIPSLQVDLMSGLDDVLAEEEAEGDVPSKDMKKGFLYHFKAAFYD